MSTVDEDFNALLARNQALRDALEEIRDLKPAAGETPTHQAAAFWRSMAFVDMQTIARRALSSPRSQG